MREKFIEVSGEFWNIRGSFKLGGVVDIKTHLSLVRLANGNFVFLDSYTLSDAARRRVSDIMGDSQLEAIINVHPFHTVHVQAMHELYPEAKLYGTERHHALFPDLPWQDIRTEDPALHTLYADDFHFSVPAGVDFISANDKIHFSSVLVMHRNSRTIHSDDTLMYIKLPLFMRPVAGRDSMSFHPTLAKALERRPGASADFRNWAKSLINEWGDAQNLCAAHMDALLATDNPGATITDRMQSALKKCETKLTQHERQYG